MSVYGRTHEHGAPELQNQVEDDDDWETDPEPANPISEKAQRWGAATLPQDGKEIKDLHSLRQQVASQHEEHVQQDFVTKKREVGDSYGQAKLRN